MKPALGQRPVDQVYVVWACPVCGWTSAGDLDARNARGLVRAHVSRVQHEQVTAADFFIQSTLKLADEFYRRRTRELSF